MDSELTIKSTAAARSSDCYTLIVCHSFKTDIFYWTEKILTPLVCPDKRKWWPSKTASVLKDCHKADRYNVVNGLLWGFPRPFNAGVVGYNTVSPIRRAVTIVHFNFTIQFVECARSFNPLIYPQSLWKSYVYLSVKRTFYLHRVWVTGVLKSVLTTDCCSCSPGWHG